MIELHNRHMIDRKYTYANRNIKKQYFKKRGTLIMSKLNDVLKLAKKQNYTILLGENGSSKFCVVPVDKEHIPDMPQRLEDQLKAEGKLGYYVGIIMPVTWEPCMDVLPIYGRTDKYETKWLCKYIEDAIDDELQDRGTKLYKRILAYEPNVAAMKSKTESIGKLHIKEFNSLLDKTIVQESTFSNGICLYDGEFVTNAKDSRNIIEVIVEQGVKTIGSFAFSHCEKLKKVTIPNSVTKIDYDAFAGCKNVTVYTDNEYARKHCEEYYGFNVLPLTKATTPDSNNNDAYIRIGKAIANYYEEIIYGSNTIHIQCANRNDTIAMYKEIADALNSIK